MIENQEDGPFCAKDMSQNATTLAPLDKFPRAKPVQAAQPNSPLGYPWPQPNFLAIQIVIP